MTVPEPTASLACTVCQRIDPDLTPGLHACYRCRGQLAAALRDLPALARLYAAMALGAYRSPGGQIVPVHTAPGSRLPTPLDTLSLLGPASAGPVTDPWHDQDGDIPVAALVGEWCAAVAAGRALTGPRSRTIGALCRWLAPHLDWCARQPFIPDMHAELAAAARRLEDRCGLTLRTQLMPGAYCPGCGLMGLLLRREGDEDITCCSCRARWTVTEVAADMVRRHDNGADNGRVGTGGAA